KTTSHRGEPIHLGFHVIGVLVEGLLFPEACPGDVALQPVDDVPGLEVVAGLSARQAGKGVEIDIPVGIVEYPVAPVHRHARERADATVHTGIESAPRPAISDGLCERQTVEMIVDAKSQEMR